MYMVWSEKRWLKEALFNIEVAGDANGVKELRLRCGGVCMRNNLRPIFGGPNLGIRRTATHRTKSYLSSALSLSFARCDMGRYNFRPLRVHHTAVAQFKAKWTESLPMWHQTVRDIPPAQTLTRPVLRIPKTRHGRKASQLFKPLPITYPEDQLRSDFFGDHPWELARPRLIVEDSGNDAKGYDWSKIVQPGKQLDGERHVPLQIQH